jgi:hypothetical protein
MTSTKRSLLVALAFIAAVGSAGCRVNKLPEYACRFKTARSQVLPPPAGEVKVEDKTKKSGITGMVASVGTFAAASSAGEKLRHVMPPERVRTLVGDVVAHEAPNLGIPFVALDKDADTRLDVEVQQYGVFAQGEQEPAKLRFHMYGRLTFLPEGEKIWEYGVIIERNLSDITVSVGGIGNVTSIAALASLSEEQLGEFFTAATQQATTEFMNKLSTEYAQAKGENKCKVAAAPPSAS